jgi:Dolichyl-phosphate-mannose-protein mannosyltransferase
MFSHDSCFMQTLPPPIGIASIFRAVGQRRWVTGATRLAIAMTLLLGLMRLPEPLWGDQALFVVGGQAIRDGALLYRDFWDVKQPGIYGLYALAGSLWGFNSVGVHLADLLWMGLLGLVLWQTQKSTFSRSWIAALLPWLCAGTYFAVIDSRQQMQVESLVGLPIYLTIWCNVQAARQPEKRWRWLMLSGVAAGVVLLLKLVYLPLLAALWLVYLLHQVVGQRLAPLPTLWQTSWPLAIGLALPLLPVMIGWIANGTLDIAAYTQLQHPTKMLQNLPRKPLMHLVVALQWAVMRFWPIILLAACGLRHIRRSLNLLTLQLLVWLGLGLAMIVAQSQSWWTYHLVLLLVPISLLAGYGLEALLTVKRGRKLARWVVLLTIGGLAVMNVMAVVDMGTIMVRSGLPFAPAQQLQYQLQKSPLYTEGVQEVALLQSPGALPGKIYVLGNPLLYLLSHRPQAVPLNGWIAEILLPEQWQQLIQQLTLAQTPYVYSNREADRYLSPSFVEFLNQRYTAVQKSEFGTWYQIKGAAA